MQDASKDEALSVTQALLVAKRSLESFVVTVEGEVSEFNNKAGYKAVYFTLKDEGSSMPCMMWANRFAQAGVHVRVGSLVRLTGRFSLYAAKGRMNFEAFSIRLAGEGELRQRVADLAKKLEAEDLMAPERKLPVPRYVETIGLVTSPRGAAVHDVLRTLRRRFPVARVLLAGVPVEGKDAPRNLIAGLDTVARAGAEVVLLVRGGGSFEDLMPFNDEGLARHIAALPVPVVTGIGHEPDTCIADMVADLRASTPTGAASAVSPLRENLATGFDNAARRLHVAVERPLSEARATLDRFVEKPLFRDSSALFANEALRLDSLSDQLYRSIPQNIRRDETELSVLKVRLSSVSSSLFDAPRSEMGRTSMRLTSYGKTFLNGRRSDVALMASRLNDLSPLNILARGYAIAYDAAGEVVRSVSELDPGDSVKVSLADGEASCAVQSVSRTQHVSIELD